MAAPITHIVLADKVFDLYFKKQEKNLFYIGTSFPDIRYLGVIDREQTHFQDGTLETLQTLPSFEAGLKFHSLVDLVRENFMQAKGIYEIVPHSPFITQALKFFEDTLLYEKRKNWAEVATYFESVTDEELSFKLHHTDIEKWHLFLQTYYMSPPSDHSIQKFFAALGKPPEMAEEIITVTQALKDIPKVTSLVYDLYHNFESLLHSEPVR